MSHGRLLQVVGVVLAVVGRPGPRTGFYAAQAPFVLGLLLVGVVLIVVGARIKDRSPK